MLCKNCRGLLVKVKKYIDSNLIKNLDIALTVTKFLKACVDNPLLSAYTVSTPTEKDDKALKIAREALSHTVFVLGLGADAKNLSTAQLVHRVANYLQDVPEPWRNALLVKIASLITKYLDSRYSENIYDTIVQARYSMLKDEQVKK